MPPPTVPGIVDKNSKPPMLFSLQIQIEFYLVEPPVISVVSFNNDILEKFFPNFITTPLYILSVNKIFDPLPI